MAQRLVLKLTAGDDGPCADVLPAGRLAGAALLVAEAMEEGTQALVH